jgi:hypothetical protein
MLDGILEDRAAERLLVLDIALDNPVLKPIRGITAGGRLPPA